MTKVDWLIVAFTVLLAMYGYAQGFIVGALSLVGFGIGAFLGTRLAPLILPGGSHSQYAPLFGLLGALLAGAVLASGFEGIGARARMFLRLPGLRVDRRAAGRGADRVGGAGDRVDRRRDRAAVDELAGAPARHPALGDPAAGSTTAAAVGADPARPGPDRPAAVGARARRPTCRAPPRRDRRRARASSAPRSSVVKVLGTACGLGIEGSGWVAGPDLVVTNAHVVAGESDTTVQVGGNLPGLDAERDRLRLPRRHRRSCACPGCTSRRCRLAANPRPGTAAGDPRLPARRRRSTPSRAASARPRR